MPVRLKRSEGRIGVPRRRLFLSPCPHGFRRLRPWCPRNHHNSRPEPLYLKRMFRKKLTEGWACVLYPKKCIFHSKDSYEKPAKTVIRVRQPTSRQGCFGWRQSVQIEVNAIPITVMNSEMENDRKHELVGPESLPIARMSVYPAGLCVVWSCLWCQFRSEQ